VVADMVYWALMVVVSRFEFRIQTCLNSKVILLYINILKLFLHGKCLNFSNVSSLVE